MRRFMALAATTFVVVAAVAMVASEAEAGCVDDGPLPDTRIRKAGSPYIGNGVEGCGSSDLLVHRSSGGVGRFEFKVRNDQNHHKAINIHDDGGGSLPDEFKIRFKRGNHDITDKMESPEGVTFENIAPGASTPLIKLNIKVLPAADPADIGQQIIGARFPSNSPNQETVTARVEVVP